VAAGESPDAPDTGPNGAAGADEVRLRAIGLLRAELDELRGRRRSAISKLLLLAGTLAVFVLTGVLDWGGRTLVLVLGAVVLHEGGHFLGMIFFGYRDVSVFFLPMFGGAATGRPDGVASWKRALVALLGPVPGLAAGLACLLLHVAAGGGTWLYAGQVLVLVNGFNLLPFFPLDGGHFLNDILFCRSRYAELLLRAGGGLGLAVLAVVGFGAAAWAVGLVGLLAALGAADAFRLAGAAARLRATIPEAMRTGSDEIPAAVVEPLAVEVMRTFKGSTDRKVLAMRMDSTWSRVRSVPPGWPASAALLTLYSAAVVFALVLAVLLAAIHASRSGTGPEVPAPAPDRGLVTEARR
jgi:Zn-dependent protease